MAYTENSLNGIRLEKETAEALDELVTVERARAERHGFPKDGITKASIVRKALWLGILDLQAQGRAAAAGL